MQTTRTRFSARLVDAVTTSRARLTGPNIRLARKLAGMSQAHLATLLGKPRERVVEWENCIHEPQLPTLTRIAEILEQPLGFFYADHAEADA